MFEQLETIPWHTLEHAYGPATDATKWIPALASDDENMRNDAVFGFLHSSICHPYSVYSATPYVIPFVVEVLRNAELRARPVAGDTVQECLFDFLHACVPGAAYAPAVGLSLRAAQDLYAAHVSDPDPRVAQNAQLLLQFCESPPAPEAAPAEVRIMTRSAPPAPRARFIWDPNAFVRFVIGFAGTFTAAEWLQMRQVPPASDKPFSALNPVHWKATRIEILAALVVGGLCALSKVAIRPGHPSAASTRKNDRPGGPNSVLPPGRP